MGPVLSPPVGMSWWPDVKHASLMGNLSDDAVFHLLIRKCLMRGAVWEDTHLTHLWDEMDKEQHLMETSQSRWPCQLSLLHFWAKVHAICPYMDSFPPFSTLFCAQGGPGQVASMGFLPCWLPVYLADGRQL